MRPGLFDRPLLDGVRRPLARPHLKRWHRPHRLPLSTRHQVKGDVSRCQGGKAAFDRCVPMMYQGAIVATMDWLYPLSGFVVGAIVGLTGMGGGSLMTPLLILLFGVHPLTAVGTDFLYAAVTKTACTPIHSQKGNVDWHLAG